jgi:protein-tyrosine phosphatase
MAQMRWYGMMGPARPGGRPGLSAIGRGLVVGEFPTPDDAVWLRDEHHVSAVVSLQDDADLASKGLVLRDLERAYRAAGLAFHRVPVPDNDTEALAARLHDLLALLDRLLASGGRVYLHCNAGFNRAPTVAIAWLHSRAGMPLAEATAHVMNRRSCVPFRTVLRAYFDGAPR